MGDILVEENLISKIVKKMVLINLIATIVFFGILRQNFDFRILLGIISGALVSIINLKILQESIKKAIQMDPERANRFATSRYILRLILVGLVFYLSLRVSYWMALGCVVGLLSSKPAVLYEGSKTSKSSSATKE